IVFMKGECYNNFVIICTSVLPILLETRACRPERTSSFITSPVSFYLEIPDMKRGKMQDNFT
ncbi:hypothetical protein, partial [Paenibacillus sp. oral taxon 786]|uniref:hypothetical protein n=1 Tax=Paenibacillus sp. oral taxon 786 TaxID=652715 RepID=UPI001E2A0E56